jgi:tetraacyldisaccharide 4'-kinase
MALIPPPAELHDLVSGRKKGIRASLFRALLTALEPFYSVAMSIRNWRYDTLPRLTTKMNVPVISVGNLTVGGTGKTPVVLWLAQRLRERTLRVAIISRGYGAESSRNDEAMELEQRLPDVPHVQHSDRVAGAQIAIEELESQILLLDDAFQHRRIARDLDIVLIDALCPFGYGHLLPRGLLRESLRGLRRAQAAVLTRSDLIGESQRRAIQSKIHQYNPNLIWAEASHAPTRLLSNSGDSRELPALQSATIAAFCGIGNPEGFHQTLKKVGANVRAFRVFPDHHGYTAQDVSDLTSWAAASGATMVVCTQKDHVKLNLASLANLPLFALQIDIRFRTGEPELLAALSKIAPRDEIA